MTQTQTQGGAGAGAVNYVSYENKGHYIGIHIPTCGHLHQGGGFEGYENHTTYSEAVARANSMSLEARACHCITSSEAATVTAAKGC
jgi:hypothetical protein